MTNDKANRPGQDKEQHSGAHPTAPGEAVKSRSDDPGQSSYGGFRNEDPSRQAQQLDKESDKDGNKRSEK